jgi:hypothetical protein
MLWLTGGKLREAGCGYVMIKLGGRQVIDVEMSCDRTANGDNADA